MGRNINVAKHYAAWVSGKTLKAENSFVRYTSHPLCLQDPEEGGKGELGGRRGPPEHAPVATVCFLSENVTDSECFKLKQIGFVDVVQIKVPIPSQRPTPLSPLFFFSLPCMRVPRLTRTKVNDWPTDAKWRRVGRYIQADILMGINGISHKMLLGAGLSVPKIQTFLEQVKQDLRNPNIRCCLPLYVSVPCPMPLSLLLFSFLLVFFRLLLLTATLAM